MRSQFFRKIVWAVDTMEREELQLPAMALIGALSRSTEAQVEPVHILAPPFVGDVGGSDSEEAFHALAAKRLAELTRKLDLPRVLSGKVVPCRKGSIGKSVDKLIEFAEMHSTDVIVVSTHAREGLGRFFMGSFAETLLLKSSVPVISVNPDTKVREQIKKILYPTTFENSYRPGFEKVAQLAKILDAQVTLFYKEPEIPPAYVSPIVHDYMVKEAADRERNLKEWQAWAEQFRVPLEIHIDTKPGHVVSAIQEYAETEDIDLIAMVSHADSVSAPLVGSVTRQVVRSAPCPVWTMRRDENEE